MKIGIVGGGAIGGFLAVALSAANVPVVVLKRHPSFEATSVTLLSGRVLEPLARIDIATDPEALAGVPLCLVAVKATDTEAVARALSPVFGRHTVVVSFQNGMRNVEQLEAELSSRVVGGVFGFNVVHEGGARRQANAGKLYAGRAAGAAHDRMGWLSDTLSRVGVKLALRHDIDAVIAGKLLLNLNNGICAATGLGIGAVIGSRDARWCFAQVFREGLQCMRAAGMRPARVGALPAWLMAPALMLPDVLITRAASALTRVEDAARSSTLADLDAGKTTEIDELNGAIVRLADRHDHNAPLNRLVTRLVHSHERAIAEGRQPTFLSPDTLRARFAQLEEMAPHHRWTT